jgi:hypothetical protein
MMSLVWTQAAPKVGLGSAEILRSAIGDDNGDVLPESDAGQVLRALRKLVDECRLVARLWRLWPREGFEPQRQGAAV